MMVTDLVRATAAGFLAWAMVGGGLTMWALVTAATLSSAARAFHRPALQASLPQLVSADGLNRANSLYQIAEAGANLIAPPLGGVFMVGLPVGTLLGAAAVSALGTRLRRGIGVIWGVALVGVLGDVVAPGIVVIVGGLLAAAGGLLGFAVPGLAKAA